MTIPSTRRLALLSALVWPLAGAVALAMDIAMLAMLGAEPWPRQRMVWGMIGWAQWGVLAPLLVWFVARFAWRPGVKRSYLLVHAVAPLVFSVLHSGSYFALRTLVTGWPGEPGASLATVWITRLPSHLTLDFLVYSATVLAVHVVLFFRGAWEREQEQLALGRRIAQTELDIFKLQLQPEMVGEKLQALEALIERDPVVAERLLGRFSTLLRQSLAAVDARRPLADEIAYANALLAVERLLDGATPALEIAVPPELAKALVPGACLTPMLHAILRAHQRAGAPAGVVRCTAVLRPAHRGPSGPEIRPARVELALATSFNISMDPDLRHLVREISARLGEDERLTHDPHAITYEGPLLTVTEETETETPYAHDEGAPEVPRRLTLPLKLLMVIGIIPGVLLILASFTLVRAVATNEPLPWRAVYDAISISWFSWPITLLMLWLGTRLRLATQTWKRSILVIAVAAAAVPPLWDLGFHTLRYQLAGNTSVWPATREFLLSSSSRTLDFLVFFGIALGALAYQRYVAWRERAADIAKLDARLLRTRARLLRLQLNPHFLFNALNSIAALLEDDPSAARRMAARLRHFVDRVLKTSDRQEVPLGEELDLLTTYVAIENVRFGERLELDLRIDETTLDAFVPSLLLQPLVENAVRHGLQPATGGRVSVTAARAAGDLRLEVLDNGRGAAAQPSVREGIGLKNTRSRLRQLYGDQYQLDVERRDDGFRATLTIPFRSAAA